MREQIERTAERRVGIRLAGGCTWRAQFGQFEDAYLRERGRDVLQVADRVLKVLSGSGRVLAPRAGTEPLVFVAHDISPADMLQLKHAGRVRDRPGRHRVAHGDPGAQHERAGGRRSNCASQVVRDDDWLVLDGGAGVVIVAPDDAVLPSTVTGWSSSGSSARSSSG